jgi:hypothetical protein
MELDFDPVRGVLRKSTCNRNLNGAGEKIADAGLYIASNLSPIGGQAMNDARLSFGRSVCYSEVVKGDDLCGDRDFKEGYPNEYRGRCVKKRRS